MSWHVALVAPPSYALVNPTLALVEELVSLGHRVSYATGPEIAPLVRAVGATPVELPWVYPKHLLSGLRPRGPGESFGTLIGILHELLADCRSEFGGLVRQFREDTPDLVCSGVLSVLGPMLSTALDVQNVSLRPGMASNAQFSLRRLLPDFDCQHPALVAYRKSVTEFAAEYSQPCPIDPQTGSNVPADLNLVFLPRRFQIAGDTFDRTFRFTGPLLSSRWRASDWRPPTGDGPLVLVALGTLFNERPEIFAACAAAFADSEWQVVMAVGDRVDIASLGHLPSNVVVYPVVPQLAVLAHASAFISHAGTNSVMESVYHRVPLVVLPQQAEQAVTARRVDELDLGRVLDPADVTPPRLRHAVEQVTANPTIRESIERFSREIHAVDGAAEAVAVIEHHMAK